MFSKNVENCLSVLTWLEIALFFKHFQYIVLKEKNLWLAGFHIYLLHNHNEDFNNIYITNLTLAHNLKLPTLWNILCQIWTNF